MLLFLPFSILCVLTKPFSADAFVSLLKPRSTFKTNWYQCQAEEASRADNTTYFSPNAPLINEADEDNRISGDISGSVNEYSFFDEAFIYVRAGSGGQGASTYKKVGVTGQNGPPDGGNGGKGGDVILLLDPSLNTLAGLTNSWKPNSFGGGVSSSSWKSFRNRPKSFRAENGADGARQTKNGRYGKDTTIRVPPGTVVKQVVESGDADSEISNDKLVDMGIVSEENDALIVARGGEGGEGSAIQGKSRGLRRLRSSPIGGERKLLKLTLKIVADVAVVGVPNAGKSTFLASVTRAKPKIANYPFTTLIPNLGVWTPASYEMDPSDSGAFESLVLCDVPGLIAGAAQGVGLGHTFLRHVERCHVILHLVDATSIDPIADYQMLNREIVKYGSGHLAKIPQVVVVNKVDAFEGRSTIEWEKGLEVKVSRSELEAKLKNAMPHSRLLWMSAKEQEGVDEVMSRLAKFVKKVKSTYA